MTAAPQAEEPAAKPPRPPLSALELFGLCGFAVAAPLFDLLGRNAEFFVAHGASAGSVLAFALALAVVPPLACLALHRLVSLIGPRAARLSGLVWLGLLVGIVAWIPLNRSETVDERIGMVVAAGIGLVAAVLYSRLSRARDLLRVGALAPLAFLILFLAEPGLRPLLSPSHAESRSIAASDTAPPIVIFVLDELPLSSIQDSTGQVDAVRFPALAALAKESLYFTGMSTVAMQTDLAIPALLTGRYPDIRTPLPILASFPENLFSLLDQRYQLNVMESISLLHPQSPLNREMRASGLEQIAADAALVYLHQILPARLRDELPRITEHWGSFWARADVTLSDAEAQIERRNSIASGRMVRTGQIDLERFGRFLETLESFESDGRPALHFLHIVYPHDPWRVLPSGALYMPDRNVGRSEASWPDEPWWSVDAYRRHLLQAMHADRLVGELVALLRAEGLYERAVLIVVADHGASFWPGEVFRSSDGLQHPEDVLLVPLIIKPPGATRHQRIDRPAELIDVLPTLAELAGFEVPWPVDGCSLLDPGCAERPVRRIYEQDLRIRRTSMPHEYPTGIADRRETLERKLALFGTDELGLYRAGRGEAIVGRRIEDLAVASAPAGRLSIDKSVRAIYRGERPGLRPARILGYLRVFRAVEGTPEVALAVNGVIQVAVPAPRSKARRPRVSAMLPESVLGDLPQGLTAYLIEGREDQPPLLHPLEIR